MLGQPLNIPLSEFDVSQIEFDKSILYELHTEKFEIELGITPGWMELLQHEKFTLPATAFP